MESLEKLAFIRKTHLFRGLSEEELTSIAGKLSETDYQESETILTQGQEVQNLFLLYAGKVIVSRTTRKGEVQRFSLVSGDHFGVEVLLRNKNSSTSVNAEAETRLLVLPQEHLKELLKEIPALRKIFELMVSTHQIARKLKYNWLEEGEVLYFICRKHPFILLQALIVPVLCLLLPVISLVLYLLYPVALFLWAAGLTLLVVLVAVFLKWLDWSNDYYIITNHRAVCLEKVILLYDSRQEAPLNTILSANTQSDFVGRTLGYGDLVVRTFVGRLVFRSIAAPDEVEALVREHWERQRQENRDSESAAMNLKIRQKLGLAPLTPPEEPEQPATKPAYTFNYFKLRFEEKGIITYRKHWVVWLKQTWLPGMLILAGLVLVIRDLFMNGFIREDYVLPEITLGLLIPIFLWWLYQTIDWSNDKFQVTEDQIFDLDRTPLGRERKNVAPLENILSMEARRQGLLQVLFNYGSVHITVGGSQLVFEDVMNPDEVQQDVEQRRMARKEKQDRERLDGERERLAEFFADYHRSTASLQAELDARGKQNPPDAAGMEGQGSKEI